MKRTALKRTTGLERRTPLRSVPPRPTQTRRPVSEATRAQRARVQDRACIVCAQHPTDPAHLIDRSLAPAHGNITEIVVPLCRACHGAYDDHLLDLSPYLEPHWRDAAAAAVEAIGLVRAYNRITGTQWMPPLEAA